MRRPWLCAAAAAAAVTIATLGAVAVVQAATLKARSAALALSLDAERNARHEAEAAAAAALAEGEPAEREAAAQREVTEMLLTSLFGAAPDPGRMGTRRDRWALRTLGRLRQEIDRYADPRVAGEIRMRYGFMLRAYRRYEEALAEVRGARDVLVPLGRRGDQRHADLTIQAALLLRLLGRGEEAVAECEAFLSGSPDEPSPYRWDVVGELALAMAAAGRPAEDWRRVADEAVAGLDALGTREAGQMAVRLHEELALAAVRAGLHEPALRWFERSLALARRHAPGSSHEARIALRTAESLVRDGRHAEAEPLAREAPEYRSRRYGPANMRTHEALVAYAGILQRAGRFTEAADLWSRAMVPLLASDVAHRGLAPLRLRCAAAMFGAGNSGGGRAMLAAALTGQMAADPADGALRDDMSRIEQALRAGGWQIDEGLRARLGELGRLLGGDPVSETVEEEDEDG